MSMASAGQFAAQVPQDRQSSVITYISDTSASYSRSGHLYDNTFLLKIKNFFYAEIKQQRLEISNSIIFRHFFTQFSGYSVNQFFGS